MSPLPHPFLRAWSRHRAWNQLVGSSARIAVYLREHRDWDDLDADTLRTAAVVAGKHLDVRLAVVGETVEARLHDVALVLLAAMTRRP